MKLKELLEGQAKTLVAAGFYLGFGFALMQVLVAAVAFVLFTFMAFLATAIVAL